MKPRITLNMTAAGELEIWLNESGRDQLVHELQSLSQKNDHFHLGPEELGEVEVSSIAYRDTDQLIEWAKVLFRPDVWDREYFPHVFGVDPET